MVLPRILVADDDPVGRELLADTLSDWGYTVKVAQNGQEALTCLSERDPPRIAILDWEMPLLSGVEVCQRVVASCPDDPPYLILLTHRGGPENIAEGLASGAHDYIAKPFDDGELAARLSVGRRVLELQDALLARVAELEQALQEVQQLQGTLPICAWCKKIRDDANYWQQVEEYLHRHTRAEFTHGICPDCAKRVSAPD